METQELFPFKDIVFKKPWRQKSKEQNSQAHGGKTIFVRDEIRSGKSIRQIQRERGLSIQQIASSRAASRKWGTEVPYFVTPHSQNIELENRLKAAEPDQEKQELLNRVKLNFYRNHIGGNDPLLVSIREVVEELGFKIGLRDLIHFQQTIKSAGILTSEAQQKVKTNGREYIQRYHFHLVKDKERAKQILLADPNLQRFRRG